MVSSAIAVNVTPIRPLRTFFAAAVALISNLLLWCLTRMHSLNNKILNEWLMKCNFRGNTLSPLEMHTTETASESSRKAWMTIFLDIGSVIDTQECKYQMSQIKIAIMQATVPSFRSQEVEEHDMTLKNFEPVCRGMRITNNDNHPNGNFFSHHNLSRSYSPQNDASNSRTTNNESGMNTTGQTISNGHDPANCELCAYGAAPIPIVTSGYVGVSSAVAVTNTVWTDEVAGSFDLQQRTGFASQEFHIAPLELDFMDTLNVTLMHESIGPQVYVPESLAQFNGPPGLGGGLLTRLNADIRDPIAASIREELQTWITSSPENLEAHCRLLSMSPSDGQQQLQLAFAFQALKSKLAKPRIAEIDDEGDQDIEAQDWNSNGTKDGGKVRMGKKQNTRHRRGDRDRVGPWCNFCLKSGMGEALSRTHYMHHPVTGITQCPRLLTYKCPLCGELGHTKSYCNRASNSKHRRNQ